MFVCMACLGLFWLGLAWLTWLGLLGLLGLACLAGLGWLGLLGLANHWFDCVFAQKPSQNERFKGRGRKKPYKTIQTSCFLFNKLHV